MYVDTALLRMGAEFSDSAATIAERGAAQLASAVIGSTVFGDFDAAHGFRSALTSAHESHVTTMNGHRSELSTLAGKVTSAATTFDVVDEKCDAALTSAASNIG